MLSNVHQIIEVNTTRVVCGGFSADNDHPRIYLTIDLNQKDFVDCPYCDCRFLYMAH